MDYITWLDAVEREVIARAGMWSPVMASTRELWTLYTSRTAPRDAAQRIACAWDAEGAAWAA